MDYEQEAERLATERLRAEARNGILEAFRSKYRKPPEVAAPAPAVAEPSPDTDALMAGLDEVLKAGEG